jgi:hypothetical protein
METSFLKTVKKKQNKNNMAAKLRDNNDMIIKLLFLYFFVGETITLRSDRVMGTGPLAQDL